MSKLKFLFLYPEYSFKRYSFKQLFYYSAYIQCNFSKPNTLGAKEKVQFREVSGLERFYICAVNIESRT